MGQSFGSETYDRHIDWQHKKESESERIDREISAEAAQSKRLLKAESILNNTGGVFYFGAGFILAFFVMWVAR